jgi:hypothetical protein
MSRLAWMCSRQYKLQLESGKMCLPKATSQMTFPRGFLHYKAECNGLRTVFPLGCQPPLEIPYIIAVSVRAGLVQRGLCGGCAPHESLFRWAAPEMAHP